MKELKNTIEHVGAVPQIPQEVAEAGVEHAGGHSVSENIHPDVANIIQFTGPEHAFETLPTHEGQITRASHPEEMAHEAHMPAGEKYSFSLKDIIYGIREGIHHIDNPKFVSRLREIQRARNAVIQTRKTA